MLELKSITKDYVIADSKVHALKGVDIAFRKNEFVSVLGPSGCGKTTLLNIIGGLDKYTSGELYIDGISTKNFSDRDWDTYRNHRIGFVFQSYNLIPHQTISENVELALTISGVEKAERVRRAHEALDKVGLKDQYNKKPNQLSGGQCQRVAIARALVNDPEILLADEPTGALDTATSVQIMDLIREIASQRLVIMVTHNPELAEKYSTRIIELRDGEVIKDSMPYVAENEQTEEVAVKDEKAKKPDKKAKLSIWSAFKLSARNLISKLKRTLLVCFAGSIGIIGVATVLAVSSGTQNYIHDMQNDMLSGNPVTVSEEAFDLSSLLNSDAFTQADAVLNSVADGYVNVDNMVDYLVKRSENMSSLRITNDISNEYVSYVKAMPEEYVSAISTYYGVNLSNNLYTDFNFNGTAKAMSLSAANRTYRSLLNKVVEEDDTGRFDRFESFSQYFSLVTENFAQAPDNSEFILSQYDIISDPETSKIASNSDEVMIVVNDETELSDLLLAQYGYYTQDEFFNVVYKAIEDDAFDEAIWKTRFSYDELMGKKFTWYPNDVIFDIDNPYDMKYHAFADDNWEGGKELKITAVLRPKEGLSYGCLSSGFYYTPALTREVIISGLQSKIARFMHDTQQTTLNGMYNNGVYTGITFDYTVYWEGEEVDMVGLVGTQNELSALMGAMSGSNQGQNMPDIYTLSLREIGGVDIPNNIRIYPKDFDYKDEVTSYLSQWNSDADLTVDGETLKAEDRANIVYTDNLAIIISLINGMIDIVTSALVAFTALSLVVSTVMIAIITYVSVIERVKEIGVIRSLGGRKRDVSALFNAETFIIGLSSGVFGIAFTYLISLIINAIIGGLFGIYTIAALPITSALIMIAVSVVLTMIAGIIPASIAAKKDPVDALRSE